MNHYLSLGGARVGNPFLMGFNRCLSQVSAARLGNAESWGRECLLPVVHGPLTRSVSMLSNGAKICATPKTRMQIDCSSDVG